MTRLHGKFVWFEHMSRDPAAAGRFYTALFGWTVKEEPIGDIRYPVIHHGGQGIGGLWQAQDDKPARWMCHMSVNDVDTAAADAKAAGATVLMGPMDFADIGRGATVADPTGGVLGFWSGKMDDPPDVPAPEVGGWCWCELMSTDVPAALAFYQRVVGYTDDPMDMGEMGTYHVLKQGDAERAGLMGTMGPDMPSFWMPYVYVADTDAIVARAQELGGSVCAPAMEIPRVGRIAVPADPLGAVFGILGPSRA
ncbi:MAG: VOC family protein [Betaproteobacteria bacterium]|nr:VOC family protein [Betaproteobacteria bacterium]